MYSKNPADVAADSRNVPEHIRIVVELDMPSGISGERRRRDEQEEKEAEENSNSSYRRGREPLPILHPQDGLVIRKALRGMCDQGCHWVTLRCAGEVFSSEVFTGVYDG